MISNQHDMGSVKWKRKILRIYRIFILFYLLGEAASFVADWGSGLNYVITYLYDSTLLPVSTMLITLFVLELLCRYTNRNLDYIFIWAAVILSGSLIITNRHIPVMQAIILVPIVLSVLYFNKVKILVTTVICLAFILIFYSFASPEVAAGFGPAPFSLIVICTIILACCAAGLIVINRGMELLEDLREKVVSEIKLREEKTWIEEMSKADALTGLANHKSFHDHLDLILDSEEHIPELELHLALADIDNFKAINDTYGHWAGDIVLKQTAAILKETLQPCSLISRYGGEEFGILFLGMTDEEARDRLEAARMAVASIRLSEIHFQAVTISIGLYRKRETDSKETLFKRADTALYEAKRTGRNKMCVSDETVA
ncbi:GGDEF domain-containing protein [Paenibacillus puerhi]|uniref:GGDEF domain-containing protein n=1 Tax=Paenibacillus puerhi TaxID=2692622 RepID=UPI00135AAAB2|nr:GGDEF domain-containing protein [Paenibacillus puerhi]